MQRLLLGLDRANPHLSPAEVPTAEERNPCEAPDRPAGFTRFFAVPAWGLMACRDVLPCRVLLLRGWGIRFPELRARVRRDCREWYQ